MRDMCVAQLKSIIEHTMAWSKSSIWKYRKTVAAATIMVVTTAASYLAFSPGISLISVTTILAAGVLAAQILLVAVCFSPEWKKQPTIIGQCDDTVLSAANQMLSIHIPAHNEPPSVLIATLEALQCQINPPHHEIIIIINNTPNPALWEPVAAWCANAGQPFRFLRHDGVAGAKSGALNIALNQMHLHATHVVVIDADYQVTPDFLQTVALKISQSNADFLQFPQAYRHLGPKTEGLSFELGDYFNRHARAANLAQAMLLTGTLSVIKSNALSDVGGWPMSSCTEDAELGTRLIAAGYKGVFIDHIVGRGLMPLDLGGLHTQRHRWAAGNARVLMLTITRWMSGGALQSTFQQKALVLSQLAAWLNLGVFATFILAIALIQIAWSPANAELGSFAIFYSASTLLLILVAAVLPLMRRHETQASLAVRSGAFLSRVAMLPVSATATVAGLAPRAQRFQVTKKSTFKSPNGRWTTTLTATLLMGCCMAAAAVGLSSTPALIAGCLLMLPPLCALAIRGTVELYADTVAVRES